MKKVIFMLAAAALVASCTKTEMNEAIDTAQGKAIQAKSNHQAVSGEVTRAPFIGSIQTGNELLARVLTFDDTDDTYADGEMTFASTGASTPYTSVTTGAEKYPGSPAGDYQLLGLFPHDNWTASLADLTAVAEYTFDGKTDVMVAAKQAVTPAEMANGTAPLLTFEHQLTKFEVKVKAKDAAAQTLWSKVNSIKLTAIKEYTNLPNSFSYKLDGTDTQYTGMATNGIDFFAIDNSGTTPDYTDVVYADGSILESGDPDYKDATVAYTMVAPFDATADRDVTIVVEAEDGTGPRTFTIEVTVPAPAAGVTNTVGYSYTILLTFADAMTIVAEAEVTAWKPVAGDLEHTIN